MSPNAFIALQHYRPYRAPRVVWDCFDPVLCMEWQRGMQLGELVEVELSPHAPAPTPLVPRPGGAEWQALHLGVRP